MPQLPSGRHVALSNVRLRAEADRYARCGEPASIGRIENADDLRPWLDVLYFRPRAGADAAPAPASNLPDGLEPYASGLTLSSIDRNEADWSGDDRDAFLRYLASEAAVKWLQRTFDEVAGRRTVKSGGDIRALAALLRATCEQDASADVDNAWTASFSDPDRVKTFAVAALAHLALAKIPHPRFYGKHADRLDRLSAFVRQIVQHHDGSASGIYPPKLPADRLAAEMWDADWFGAMSEKTRAWLTRQLPHEIANILPALDNDKARTLLPVECEIIQAAWLSPYVTEALYSVAEDEVE